MIKALEFASRSPDAHHSLGTQFDEEAAVFNLELLLRVVLYNRCESSHAKKRVNRSPSA